MEQFFCSSSGSSRNILQKQTNMSAPRMKTCALIHTYSHGALSCIEKQFSGTAILLTVFYVYGSVHRWSISIIVQRDATQSSLFIILQVHCTCFGYQASLATLEGGSCTKIWPVPKAVVIVLCTPDDGCGWHPKYVEWYNVKCQFDATW